MNKKNFAILVLLLAAGCAGDKAVVQPEPGAPPPLDPSRKISEQDCGFAVDIAAGNLLCMGPEAAERERQRRAEEEERQARARKEAADRAARERAERERAEQLAREEAARKAREAEEARLAAERRRLEEEAALKARLERERQEREAAEALARQRAEQEKREAAERECRRLEQERLDGRVALEDFVSNYGTVDEYREIAGQIAAFLKKPRKPKPCP